MTQRPELIKLIKKELRPELNSIKASIRENKSMTEGYPTKILQRLERFYSWKLRLQSFRQKIPDPYFSYL